MTIKISAQQNTDHLSEEALDDVLIGLGSSESEAHLYACSACRDALQQFQSSMQTFNRASLAWSEARPMPKPMAKAVGRIHANSNRKVLAPLGWATAVALLVVLGLQIRSHEIRQPSTVPLTSSSESGDLEVQIAQDNQLLRSVDAALSASDMSTVNEYGLQSDLRGEPRVHSRRRPKAGNR